MWLGVLVFCSDSDTLVVDFGPNSSSVTERKSAWIGDFGRLNWSASASVGLPIWAAFRFFLHWWRPPLPEEEDMHGRKTTSFQGEGGCFSI